MAPEVCRKELPSSSSSSWSSRRGSLVSSLLSRQLIPERSGSYNSLAHSAYRPLIRKSLRRASRNSRKVFKTQLDMNSMWGGPINPVYDLAYSPVGYGDHRILAVGDEFGYLSVVKVGLEGQNRCGASKKEVKDLEAADRVYNYGAKSVSPLRRDSLDEGFGSESDESSTIPPVLYTLAWNSDGNRIASGYGDGSIRIWDLSNTSSPRCVSTIPAYEKALKRVTWCEERLVSCSRTNEIFVHDQRMRNPLTNRIDCSQLNSKLTDVSVVSDVYILASSSNQSALHLFDLRYTYKLYKRIKPVETFALSSPGYTTMKYDHFADDGIVYALGSDSVIHSVNYRSGDVGASYRVPGWVDFFTKIDVDKFSEILVAGGTSDTAWGFDLRTQHEKGCHVEPFVSLREGKKPWVEGKEDDGEEEENKENEEREERGSEEDSDGSVHRRHCSAVALGTRRGFQDCTFQIACGGDNSTVLVYD